MNTVTTTENSATTRLNLDVLRELAEPAYIDGNIVLIDDLKALAVHDACAVHTVQMDMIIVLACMEGKLQVNIDAKLFRVNAGELLICPPHVFVDDVMASPDFSGKIFGLSYTALQRLLHVRKDIWDVLLYIKRRPIFPLSEKDIALLTCYHSLLRNKIDMGKRTYDCEVMPALFQAIFYELCSVIAPHFEQEATDDGRCMKQSDVLTHRFLKLLADSRGRERCVSAYATKLCVTPKYLTSVCRASTGKTPTAWIHEYTINVIEQELKHSNRSIKEISTELDFPNVSFFGKFVKAHLGVSPRVYRQRLADSAANA